MYTNLKYLMSKTLLLYIFEFQIMFTKCKQIKYTHNTSIIALHVYYSLVLFDNLNS